MELGLLIAPHKSPMGVTGADADRDAVDQFVPLKTLESHQNVWAMRDRTAEAHIVHDCINPLTFISWAHAG
jgi:hypothetical protein